MHENILHSFAWNNYFQVQILTAVKIAPYILSLLFVYMKDFF